MSWQYGGTAAHTLARVCKAGECSGETPECMVSNLEKPWK